LPLCTPCPRAASDYRRRSRDLVLAALTAILAPLVDEDALLPVALGYLLIALLASALWGWAVGLFAAVASNLLVNFFFVPPLHTFTVGEPENVVALVMFLAVAATGAGMLSLLRRQVTVANAARAESAILLSLSHEVASASRPGTL
jgi:two-component system sensor histidine kinase KdpD